jgi:carbamoyl-phosphate synthase large subunit
MKSVGEVMAIGRTFQESLQKALRGLETGVDGFNLKTVDPEKIGDELAYPSAERLWYVADAFGVGMSLEEVFAHTKIDRWFLAQIKEIVDTELALDKRVLGDLTRDELRGVKRMGFSIGDWPIC